MNCRGGALVKRALGVLVLGFLVVPSCASQGAGQEQGAATTGVAARSRSASEPAKASAGAPTPTTAPVEGLPASGLVVEFEHKDVPEELVLLQAEVTVDGRLWNQGAYRLTPGRHVLGVVLAYGNQSPDGKVQGKRATHSLPIDVSTARGVKLCVQISPDAAQPAAVSHRVYECPADAPSNKDLSRN